MFCGWSLVLIGLVYRSMCHYLDLLINAGYIWILGRAMQQSSKVLIQMQNRFSDGEEQVWAEVAWMNVMLLHPHLCTIVHWESVLYRMHVMRLFLRMRGKACKLKKTPVLISCSYSCLGYKFRQAGLCLLWACDRQQIGHVVTTIQRYTESQLLHVIWSRFLNSVENEVYPY